MIDLRQYIEESLLDDFDTLSNNQDYAMEHPFVTLYKEAKNNNWDNAVNEFEDTISSDGEWVTSRPRGLAKDEVFVAFYTDSWAPNQKNVYVRFNNTQFQIFRKSQGRSARYKDPVLTIWPFKYGNRKEPSISSALNVDMSTIKGGYILSDKHAADALRMLQLMSEYKWNEKYW